MRDLPLALALCMALSLPAAAQTAEQSPLPEDRPEDLLDRGAKLFLRGLLQEMQPHLDEMAKMVTELEPVMREMARMVDDVRNYDTPRLLPNGDILIPRRPGAPPSPLLENRPGDPPTDAPLPGPGGEIEL